MKMQRMYDLGVMNSTPSTGFTRVKNIEFDKEGSVEDWLNKQFTVNYDDGTYGFLFYADNGVTWHPLDEKKKKSKLAADQLGAAESKDYVEWLWKTQQAEMSVPLWLAKVLANNPEIKTMMTEEEL